MLQNVSRIIFELKYFYMTGQIPFEFSASCWKYKGKASWYFITIPTDLSREIRQLFGKEEQGWGRLAVEAQIGKTTWSSAIWFDTKKQEYLLPLKAEIRRKENIHEGNLLEVKIRI